MGRLIIGNLDDRVIESLQARAERQDRSLDAESRMILERAAGERTVDIAEARGRAEKIGRSPEGRPHG